MKKVKSSTTVGRKYDYHSAKNVSFHFRFYVLEQIIVEEINDRDAQAVTQLLQRGNGGAVVAAANHIVHGGLRDAADRTQLVNSQVSLCT